MSQFVIIYLFVGGSFGLYNVFIAFWARCRPPPRNSMLQVAVCYGHHAWQPPLTGCLLPPSSHAPV